MLLQLRSRFDNLLSASIWFGIFCSGTIISFPLNAMETIFTEDDYFADIPKINSATRLAQHKTDTPASITIIDRQMIEASGVTDIADILRLVPGFQVGHANGNIYAVTSHGIAFEFPRKLQILIDGRSVYRPLLSNIDWANLGISIIDIERIEVIRGPNAPSYGTNAFLGTVNIITRQGYLDTGTYVKHISGDINFQQTTMRYAAAVDKFNYRLTAQSQRDDGFENVNDQRDTDMITFRGTYDVDASNVADIQMGLNQGEFGAWGKDDALNPVREKQVDSWYYYFRWTNFIRADEEFSFQFYRNNYRQRDNYTIGPLSEYFGIDAALIPFLLNGQPDQIVDAGIYDGIADRFDVEFQHIYPLALNTRLVWGAGLRSDSFTSPLMLDQQAPVEDKSQRLFSNLEWRPVNSSVINLGAMFERNELMGTKLSPRAGYNVHLNDMNTLRASATRAYRSPSLYEAHNRWLYRLDDGSVLNTIYVSDPELQEETITAYEIGYMFEHPTNGISVDVKIFREKLNNLITAPTDSTYPDTDFTNLALYGVENKVKIWANGGYATTDGIEIQLDYKPSARTTLTAQVSYAEVQGELQYTRNPDTYYSIEKDTPEITASFLIDHTFANDWRYSLMTFYMDEMLWEGDGHLVAAYTRVDSRIAKRMQLGDMTSTLSISAQNLLDEKYQEFSRHNNFERRVFVSIDLKM